MLLIEITNKNKYIVRLLTMASILLFLSIISGLLLINHQNAILLKIFYVNNNSNIPRWVSSILLFIGGTFSYLIYLRDKKIKTLFSWRILSIVFLFLSLAKSTSVDEQIFSEVRNDFNIIGFHINSFLFGALLILLFIILFIKFYLKLNKKIRKFIFFAAFIYIVMSLNFEVLSSIFYHKHILYVVFSGIEEFCEMSGSIVFIYALLMQIELLNSENPAVPLYKGES